MAISPGTKLGPYEIQGPLGTGGMGEVYRAHDSRLDRTVAIKILPSEFAADKDRLNRFEREARSASALNHPNIVTIYELGHHDSVHYIAMELIEGKTLRELLDAGALPIRKALDIAAQVAEGLAKAHAASIAHRDIKPANLMITQDGFVKILDFGLAKIASAAPLTQTTSLADPGTHPGTIIGTPEYMSPEQASGLGPDFRSDQFSFGTVLYEMLTGMHIFRRRTAAETLVAVLRDPIDPIALQATEAPAPLCWAVERCLAKEPEQRYVSTRDLARELAAIRDRFAEKPTRPAEVRANNIPAQRTAFVGREKEVAAANELLLRPDVRLVTITGPGGIGKTRLAVEIATTLVNLFPGGIHFVPLAPVTDPALILPAIIQTLGLRAGGGQSPAETLRKHLQHDSHLTMLLVLDNFEHLVQAGPTVAELLAIGSHLKILVTSRAPLHIYGEHEFPVPPLALPDSRSGSSHSPESLSSFAAVALFVQRAAASKPGFELNKENASSIIEICSRLDGLPLAIELAAARVKVLSPSAMRTRLASRLQLLTGGSRDLPERQQTLRGAIDWSYDLLSSPEQTLFRRLSVFSGGCTLEGLEAVCNTKGDLALDLLDGMSSMVDKSLLHQVEQPNGESRFTMLETIREYAREKLEASSESRATRRAHAAYCLVLAEEDTGPSAAEQAGWLERLTLENDNFRAALEWLAEIGNADWGLRLAAALFRFWEAREYFAEGRSHLAKLLRLEENPVLNKTRARALFSAGVLGVEQRDYHAAETLLKESGEVSEHLGDQQGVAVSLNALAVVYRDRGDLPGARELFEKNLEQWQEMGDRAAVARSLSNLANIVNLQGDYARARSLYDASRAMFERLRDHAGVAWSLNYQGDVARIQGDYPAAHSLYENALTIFRELDDRWGIAGSLADLGNLAREQNDCAAAHSLYCESLKIFKELEHKRGVARVLECFAASAAIQNQPERALHFAGAAAALRENIGTPLAPAEQVKLETILQPARQSLSGGDVAAWLEGWSTPVEKAVDDALASHVSPSTT